LHGGHGQVLGRAGIMSSGAVGRERQRHQEQVPYRAVATVSANLEGRECHISNHSREVDGRGYQMSRQVNGEMPEDYTDY
jgi:hypothetical protein